MKQHWLIFPVATLLFFWAMKPLAIAGTEEKPFLLFYSGNVLGETDPCG